MAQIANALTLVLLAALALSFGVQDFTEGGVIAGEFTQVFTRISLILCLGVITLNTVIGFVQEYKAEKTMESLRNLSSPTALVVRDDQPVSVASKLVVPGDLVQIKAGDVCFASFISWLFLICFLR